MAEQTSFAESAISLRPQLSGYGTVSTSNNLATPSIDNGRITGDSADQPIALSGYVKGVGTLDNVEFFGMSSRGLSPRLVA